MVKRISDMTPTDLEKQLVGHYIVSSDFDSLTLDNGTVLKFEDVSDCCAWFSMDGLTVEEFGTIITAVGTRDGLGEDDEYGEYSYTITLLSASKEVGHLNISGDPTSGYYCNSITLNVLGGKKW